MAAVRPCLHPEDRHESKHSKGGLSKPAFGVNEIVTLVYPHIKREYLALHLASCTSVMKTACLHGPRSLRRSLGAN
jgi:hypothetical protein